MKRLPLGVQNFREIVEKNHVYIDKTQYIYELINSGKCYFLSRPRRFGKSLLLDTIAEVFLGNKELFKGLWIYDSDYGFDSHPVVRLDMSNVDTMTPTLFSSSLSSRLRDKLEKENIKVGEDAPPGLLNNLIEGLHFKYNKKVVVLIDEYDKPILDHIKDKETAEAMRGILRSFYGILKSLDPYLEFTFFTGVSKFTKTSVFSSLNNLSDITMSRKYANICGIPVDELEKYFGDRMKLMKNYDLHKTYDELHDLILKWYDGYSWDGVTKLLNPFGLLSFFFHEDIKSYWYASGSPKFLIDLIKTQPGDVAQLQNISICEVEMDAIDIGNFKIGPLLLQTGYLTVSKIVRNEEWPEYELEIPNLEVKEAFFRHITAGLVERDFFDTSNAYREIRTALRTGNLEGILTALRSLFASIPYQLHIKAEAYYHSIFFCVMNVLGFEMDAEVSVSRGRIDAVLVHGDKVYVFEFKYENCPPDAGEEEKRMIFETTLKNGMKQINEKGYADRYMGSGKTVYQAVFAFLGRDSIEMDSQVTKG